MNSQGNGGSGQRDQPTRSRRTERSPAGVGSRRAGGVEETGQAGSRDTGLRGAG